MIERQGSEGAAGRRRRLRPSWRKALLAFHISTSVALIGSTASVVVLGVRAASAEPTEAHALYESALALAFVIDIPLSFATLIGGLLLGAGTTWGVLRYYWVVAKLGLLVGIIAVGALGVGPQLQRLAADTAGGVEGAALGSSRGALLAAGAVNLAFAGCATVLSVYKPWGRIRRPHAGERGQRRGNPTGEGLASPGGR